MAKPLMSDAEMKRRKKLQSHISIAGGTLGLGALAARGGAGLAGGGKLARLAKVPGGSPKLATKLKDLSTGLTTAGAGIGGAGAYNFAAYTNAESRKRVQKNYGGTMDFGLDSVQQGDASRLEEVSKKDWMNISEHQRRRSDSRRTSERAKNAAGLGGAVIAGTASMATHNRVNPAAQAMHFGHDAKHVARGAMSGKLKVGALPKWGKLVVARNPYGAAIAGGAAALGGGMATSAGATLNAKRHDRAISRQRRAKVGKAFDPARSRQRRHGAYADAASMGAGASFVGAGLMGRKALGTRPNVGPAKQNVPPGKKIGGGTIRNVGTGLRSHSGPQVRAGMKMAGKAGALGLTGIGLQLGSERIRDYGKARGRHR